MSDFEFNQGDALNADKSGLGAKTGFYVVNIKAAYKHTAASGAEAITFNFETEGGAQINNIDLYYKSKKGEKTFQKDVINSCLGILKLEGMKLSPDPIEVDRYGKKEKVLHYPALKDKKIGIVIQREEKLKRVKDENNAWVPNGEVRYDVNLLHFCHPETKQTYAEIFYEKEAHQIPILLKTLDDIRLSPADLAKVEKAKSSKTSTPPDQSDISPPEDEDDLPF